MNSFLLVDQYSRPVPTQRQSIVFFLAHRQAWAHQCHCQYKRANSSIYDVAAVDAVDDTSAGFGRVSFKPISHGGIPFMQSEVHYDAGSYSCWQSTARCTGAADAVYAPVAPLPSLRQRRGTCGVCAGESAARKNHASTGKGTSPLQCLPGPSQPLSDIGAGDKKAGSRLHAPSEETEGYDCDALITMQTGSSHPGTEKRGRIRTGGSIQWKRPCPREGVIVGYKHEPDDDFLSSSEGSTPDKTMIIEIPDPLMSASARWLPEIKAARSAFVKRFQTQEAIKHVNVPATSRRWDFSTSSTGNRSRPEWHRMHPVIRIEFAE